MSFTNKTEGLNQQKVPWEPYKAATNQEKQLKSKFLETDKQNLIKYKIDTNLEKFNMNRPGYQFDEFDFKQIEANLLNFEENLNELFVKTKLNKSSDLSTNLAKELVDNNNKLPPNFVDARFYTDVHFLKLANQLKKNTLHSNEQTKNTSNGSNKPVNIVGPMIEKKKESTNMNLESVKNEQNAAKLWRMQCDKYEARIDYLENQMKGINEQLQIQTQVNAELKKMLIASVGGEDLQYKLERLINDKQRYEVELQNRQAQIEKMTEEIEIISIQCDLWRSKYLASRLLAEENSTWKSFLIMLTVQHEKLLKNLLNDDELLNLKLNQALDILISYKDKTNKDSIGSQNLKNKKMNNLQAINVLLSNLCLLDQSLSKKLVSSVNLSPKKRSKTINEIAAEQALEQFDWVKKTFQTNPSNSLNMIDSLDNLEKLVKNIKQNRSTKFSRLYQPESVGDNDFLLNICNKCKGNIQVV